MTLQKPAPEKRPPGKPSLSGSGESPVIQFRGPEELKERVRRNGPQWARDVLAAAPDPEPQ